MKIMEDSKKVLYTITAGTVLLISLAFGCEQHGPVIEHYNNGQVKIKGDTINGEYRTWYSNGQLKSEGQYKDGKMHGVWKAYDKEGNLLTTTAFKNGKRHGEYTYYDKKGNKKWKIIYENDSAIDKKFYDKSSGVTPPSD